MPAPIGYRRRILAVGLIVAGALYSFGAPLYVNRIEDDLERRVPAELAEAGVTGLTAEFDGQDGTLSCAQPLGDPEQAIEDAYDVWGVHAITLDRSCRVNRAPETGGDDPGSAEASTGEQSNVVQAAAGAGVDAAILYPTIGDLLDTDPRLSYLATLLSEAGLGDAIRGPGHSPCSPPPTKRSRSCRPTPTPACAPIPSCCRTCSAVTSHRASSSSLT
jgi:hypothetical protein